jgi:hypothetical protein
MAAMIESIKRAGLIAALLLGPAASAQDPSYGTRIPPPSLLIAETPPCVDGAMLGDLRRTGTDTAGEAGPLNGLQRSWFEFRRQRTLFGPEAPASLRFHVIGESPYLPERPGGILLLRRTPGGDAEMVHTDVVIRDRRGRPFIPLVWAPIERLRGASWLPLGFEAFARPVRYDDREMSANGHAPAHLADIARAGARNRNWVVRRGGRAVVRQGLYLDELAAMFARQRPEHCSRPDPRLANPRPSR